MNHDTRIRLPRDVRVWSAPWRVCRGGRRLPDSVNWVRANRRFGPLARDLHALEPHPGQTGAAVGERGQLRGVGSAHRLQVSADQHRDVGIGPRDSAEYLPGSAGCLDVADANLQMPFSIVAATNEGQVHGDRDGRRGGRRLDRGGVTKLSPALSVWPRNVWGSQSRPAEDAAARQPRRDRASGRKDALGAGPIQVSTDNAMAS